MAKTEVRPEDHKIESEILEALVEADVLVDYHQHDDSLFNAWDARGTTASDKTVVIECRSRNYPMKSLLDWGGVFIDVNKCNKIGQEVRRSKCDSWFCVRDRDGVIAVFNIMKIRGGEEIFFHGGEVEVKSPSRREENFRAHRSHLDSADAFALTVPDFYVIPDGDTYRWDRKL